MTGDVLYIILLITQLLAKTKNNFARCLFVQWPFIVLISREIVCPRHWRRLATAGVDKLLVSSLSLSLSVSFCLVQHENCLKNTTIQTALVNISFFVVQKSRRNPPIQNTLAYISFCGTRFIRNRVISGWVQYMVHAIWCSGTRFIRWTFGYKIWCTSFWKHVLLPPNTFGYNIEEGSDCSIARDKVRKILLKLNGCTTVN